MYSKQHVVTVRRQNATTAVDCDSESALAEDLNRLREKEELCDAVVECDGSAFPVHSLVLSARSDVFAALFANWMKEEAGSNRIVVEDVDALAMSRFLR